MVTKRRLGLEKEWFCSVLAKILMVTKPTILVFILLLGSVLAKILMVTKPTSGTLIFNLSSVLAKILMVTKLKSPVF